MSWSVNAPGLGVAATPGVPWFKDARCSGLVRAACSCCVYAATGGMCLSRATDSCCDVGRALMPPLPPLWLTRLMVVVLLITVVL